MQIGVHIGAQTHANYSDQGFKWLECIYIMTSHTK